MTATIKRHHWNIHLIRKGVIASQLYEIQFKWRPIKNVDYWQLAVPGKNNFISLTKCECCTNVFQDKREVLLLNNRRWSSRCLHSLTCVYVHVYDRQTVGHLLLTNRPLWDGKWWHSGFVGRQQHVVTHDMLSALLQSKWRICNIHHHPVC